MASSFGQDELVRDPFTLDDTAWGKIRSIPELANRFNSELHKIKNQWRWLYRHTQDLTKNQNKILNKYLFGDRSKRITKKIKEVPLSKKILRKLTYVNHSLSTLNLDITYDQLTDLIDHNTRVGSMGVELNKSLTQPGTKFDLESELENLEDHNNLLQTLTNQMEQTLTIDATKQVRKGVKYIRKMLGEPFFWNLNDDQINYGLAVATDKEEYEDVLDGLREYLVAYSEHQEEVNKTKETLSKVKERVQSSEKKISRYKDLTEDIADIVTELGLEFQEGTLGKPQVVKPESMSVKDYRDRVLDFVEDTLQNENFSKEMEELLGEDFLESLLPQYIGHLIATAKLEQKYKSSGLINLNSNGFYSITEKGEKRAKRDGEFKSTIEDVLGIPTKKRSKIPAIAASIVGIWVGVIGASLTERASGNTQLYHAKDPNWENFTGIIDEVNLEVVPTSTGETYNDLTLSWFDLKSDDDKIFNPYKIGEYEHLSFSNGPYDLVYNGEVMSVEDMYWEIVDSCENILAQRINKDKIITDSTWEDDYGKSCAMDMNLFLEEGFALELNVEVIDKPKSPMSFEGYYSFLGVAITSGLFGGYMIKVENKEDKKFKGSYEEYQKYINNLIKGSPEE